MSGTRARALLSRHIRLFESTFDLSFAIFSVNMWAARALMSSIRRAELPVFVSTLAVYMYRIVQYTYACGRPAHRIPVQKAAGF